MKTLHVRHSSRRALRTAFPGRALLVLLATGLVGSAAAQTIRPGQDPLSKDFVIANLRVVGTSRAMGNIIYLNADLAAGTTKDRDGVQNSLKRIWSLGLFKSIEILQDSVSNDSVWLTIQVQEHPRLGSLKINGNDAMKDKDIQKFITLYPGQVISDLRIVRLEQKLSEEYIKKGYLHARLIFDVTPANDAGSIVDITLNIEEGASVQVKRIRFFGNTSFEDKKLRGTFKETKEDTWWRGADFKPKEYEVDKALLLEFYRKEGFREARILSDSIYYSDDQKDMFIDITVDEGPQFYFGAITFEGNSILETQALRRLMTYSSGERYSEEKFRTTQEAIQNAYYDQGYVYAQIAPREIMSTEDTVQVAFVITENNPARINRINFEGNTKTKDHVMRRELKLRPGDIFTRSALERSQRELMILNYFSNVIPGVDPMVTDQDLVNINMVVEEKNTDTANMSAGFSQRDGLIGSLGLSMANFRGSGQRLSFEWTFGRFFQSQSISFVEPWFMGTPTTLGISIFNSKRSAFIFPFDWANRGITFSVGRRLSWPDDFFRVDYRMRISQSAISNIRTDVGLEQFLVGRTANAISFTQIISRDSRDAPEFPTRGSVFTLETELSGGPLGGGEDYYSVFSQVQRFMPIFWKFVLYDNAEFGYIKGIGEEAYIPPLSRYYMGGTALTIGNQLRGYGERLVGPRSSGGAILGGRIMSKYTTELRFPIIPNPTVFGIFFFEAGNVWDTLAEVDMFGLKRSMGFGGRVFMPLVGLLGFDYAYGFDNDIIDLTTGRPTGRTRGEWRPHFQFGRTF